ncbi:hypothetical protein CEXT_640441 [Caerostris extrusa]|uniref:Uncharacterized protein n=1 Tax=Caerostris extrusa TaxID=172846 RepID=A0AAV4MYR0_CAEEX|nr:hypothetical protein CEXT_640441 [Caerostris extrusa]
MAEQWAMAGDWVDTNLINTGLSRAMDLRYCVDAMCVETSIDKPPFDSPLLFRVGALIHRISFDRPFRMILKSREINYVYGVLTCGLAYVINTELSRAMGLMTIVKVKSNGQGRGPEIHLD